MKGIVLAGGPGTIACADPDQLQDYIEWLPEGFDPHRFDHHACTLRVNDYLRTVRSFIE